MTQEQYYTDRERRAMLSFVRQTIGAELGISPKPHVPDIDGKLHEQRSCFVTLHTADGNLRGCIGSIAPFESLGENLRRHAINAAFHDPRFAPLDADEYPEIAIEVSVLSEPKEIRSTTDFVPGKHGIIFVCGNFRSVFLPQVPVEQKWDRETTLGYLAEKAGMEREDWQRPDAQFAVFTAEVFSEGEVSE